MFGKLFKILVTASLVETLECFKTMRPEFSRKDREIQKIERELRYHNRNLEREYKELERRRAEERLALAVLQEAQLQALMLVLRDVTSEQALDFLCKGG